MRKNVCSQNIQIKLITLRWSLKEGTFRRKGFSRIASTNEQNFKKFRMKMHNRRLSLQEDQEVSCPRLSYVHRILEFRSQQYETQYDKSYSFFNFESAENDDNFHRQMCNKTLSNSSLVPIKFKRIQTLCSHLILVSDQKATFPI